MVICSYTTLVSRDPEYLNPNFILKAKTPYKNYCIVNCSLTMKRGNFSEEICYNNNILMHTSAKIIINIVKLMSLLQ